MIKIFLESDKFSHIAGVTLHATNILACKSQFIANYKGRKAYTAYKNQDAMLCLSAISMFVKMMLAVCMLVGMVV